MKHKDLFQKNLQNVKVEKDLIEFTFAHKKHYYVISEKLDAEIISKIKKFKWKTIVCLNTEENLMVLTRSWKKFAAINQLYIIFVSENRGKWIICPESHNIIADPESLEEGLKSMFTAAEGRYSEVER